MNSKIYIEIIWRIFDAFNEKHDVKKLKLVHKRKKLKSVLVTTGIIVKNKFSSSALNLLKPLDGIYLDFSKAFDTVSHNELLVKLWMIGISLLLSYLPIYSVEITNLEFVLSHRDLGIIVSHNLTWSNHFKVICPKDYSALALIRRTF